MLLIKVHLPFLYSSLKKKIIKLRLIFDIEKWLNQNFAISIPNRTKYLETFCGNFHGPLALFTHHLTQLCSAVQLRSFYATYAIFSSDANNFLIAFTGMVDHWVKDENASACIDCGVKFTIYERRHHCRSCGQLCTCSSHVFTNPEFSIFICLFREKVVFSIKIDILWSILILIWKSILKQIRTND